MGVTGELQADAGLFDDGQAAGHVIEQDACFAPVEMQTLQNGAKADGIAGVTIGNARDLHAIDGDHFIGQDANADAGEDCAVEGGVAKLVMIAGGEVAAEGRGQRAEGLGQRHGVGLAAVEQVAGKKDYVRVEACGQRRDAPAKTGSVHVAEVQVADHESGAATPGCRQAWE